MGQPGSLYHLPGYTAKTGLPEEVVREHCAKLRQLYFLMYGIQTDPDVLPVEQKTLRGGYTARWYAKTEWRSYTRGAAVVFVSPENKQIVFAPENGKQYFDRLTEMTLLLEDKGTLSIVLRLSLPELKAMLALVKETYVYLDGYVNGEYHTLLGVFPIEGEKLLQQLRRMIATFPS